MLDEILAYKRKEVRLLEEQAPLEELRPLVAGARPPRSFADALGVPGVSLIAEVKYKSPSKGVLRWDFDALEIARLYAENGAHAISVLADKHFFGGGPDMVRRVTSAQEVGAPVMFKEFVVNPYQVYQARAAGADAVLLIVRAVSQQELVDLLILARELGMEALVEVFLPGEAERALSAGAAIIGINNRDLQTFEIDAQRSTRIRSMIPDGILTVSESGLKSREEVLQAEAAGFDGVLVGEALLTAPDIGAQVRELTGVGLRERSEV